MIMEFINKIEKQTEKWLRDLKLPHLPKVVRNWIGVNFWRVASICAVLAGISVLFTVNAIFKGLTLMSALPHSWMVSATVTWALVMSFVNLVFVIVEAIILGLSVKPLQLRQKKGWMYLFIILLIGALMAAVRILVSIVTFNALSLISTVLFGGLSLALGTYLLFEIRDEFMHVEKTAGAKAKVAAKSTTKK